MAAVTGMGRADQPASHAAAELYEQHSRRIFGYCLSRLGRREDAEDATQLTFLHAIRGLRRGVVPAAESAWLFGIARNVCLSRRASAGRRSRVEAACDPAELERVAAAHAPHRDELIGLECALELLPEQQRRAVLLRDWRGLSYEEVADRLGVSHAAVETLIFRGRVALAEHLREEPRGSRRRLQSLSGVWSLLDAIKNAFAGAAAGAKVAAAVAAAIAVSGGGIALGTKLTRNPLAKPPAAVSAVTPLGDAAAAPALTGESPSRRSTRSRKSTTARARVVETADRLALVPAGAPGAVPSAEAEPETDVRAGAPSPATQPDAAAAPPVALPVAAPTLDAAVGAAPTLDAPLLPPVGLPATEGVVVVTEGVVAAAEGVVAATAPVTAVVNETLASTPLVPAVPPPPIEPPLPALPPAPAVPLPGVTPSLP